MESSRLSRMVTNSNCQSTAIEMSFLPGLETSKVRPLYRIYVTSVHKIRTDFFRCFYGRFRRFNFRNGSPSPELSFRIVHLTRVSVNQRKQNGLHVGLNNQ